MSNKLLTPTAAKTKPRRKPSKALHAQRRIWGTRTSTVLTILGVLLAVVGLIGLRPKPVAAQTTPLNPNDALSSPITISNEGVLDMRNVRIAYYFRRTEDANQNILARSGLNIKNLVINSIGPPIEVPIINALPFGVYSPITSADVAVIVSYEWEYVPFVRRRKAFRFMSVREYDGKLRLVRAPAEGILAEFDAISSTHH